jgi:hypothetical protein
MKYNRFLRRHTLHREIKVIMPRKTHPEKNERSGRSSMETRTPRPKPKIDFHS